MPSRWKHRPERSARSADAAGRAERWRQGFVDRPEGRTTWVAETGGELVGFVAFGRSRDEDATACVGELQAIYVLADWWRRGVGTALQDVCLAELRGAGYCEARLWVLDANPGAKAFYAALGWHPDGASAPQDFAGTDLPVVRYRRML